MRRRYRLVVGATLVFVSACGGGSGSGGYPTGSNGQNPPPGGQQPPASSTNAIDVKNNHFDPSALTVPPGGTVTWTWDTCSDDGYGGETCVDHNVTFDGNGGGSPTQSKGTYSRQFNTAGTFAYRCTQHSGMTGQVIVR